MSFDRFQQREDKVTGLTRRELFRRMAGIGAGVASMSLLAACAPVAVQQAGSGDAVAPGEETTTIRFGMWGSAGAGVAAPVQDLHPGGLHEQESHPRRENWRQRPGLTIGISCRSKLLARRHRISCG